MPLSEPRCRSDKTSQPSNAGFSRCSLQNCSTSKSARFISLALPCKRSCGVSSTNSHTPRSFTGVSSITITGIVVSFIFTFLDYYLTCNRYHQDTYKYQHRAEQPYNAERLSKQPPPRKAPTTTLHSRIAPA